MKMKNKLEVILLNKNKNEFFYKNTLFNLLNLFKKI